MTREHVKLLLTPPEAAERLSISERKLWDLTAPRGPIPSVRIGRSVRYYLADLTAWIESERRILDDRSSLGHAASRE